MTMNGMTELKPTDGYSTDVTPDATEQQETTTANDAPKFVSSSVVLAETPQLNGETVGDTSCENPHLIAKDVNVFYGDNHAIKNVSLEIGKKQVVALIGPSGCGKSTFLRCLN